MARKNLTSMFWSFAVTVLALTTDAYSQTAQSPQKAAPQPLRWQVSECEGTDNCATWTFFNTEGLGTWRTGEQALLRVLSLKDGNIVIGRVDAHGTKESLTATYRGTLRGNNRVAGTYDSFYDGHREFGDWYWLVEGQSINPSTIREAIDIFQLLAPFFHEIFTAIENHDLAKAKTLLTDNPPLVFSRTADGTELLALATDSIETVKLLLASGADVNSKDGPTQRTALTIASEGGREEVVKLLLTHNAAVNARDEAGRTALWFAADSGNDGIARLLLAHGANVNDMDNYGDVPLFRAVVDSTKGDPSQNDLATVKLLLTNGAKINAKDREGKTVLHQLVDHGWPFEEYATPVLAFLIANKADVNAIDNDGYSPLHYAKLNEDKALATLLIRHGGRDIARPANRLREAITEGDAAKVGDLLKQDPKLATEKDQEGATPLHWATGTNQLAVAELLFNHGVNVDEIDLKGRTALHYAALNNTTSAAEALLAHGANINATATDGNTPLIDAAIEGRAAMVEVLLAHGADVNAKNKYGRTALSEAVTRGDPNTILLLKGKGGR